MHALLLVSALSIDAPNLIAIDAFENDVAGVF